jgi:hypothetical protein
LLKGASFDYEEEKDGSSLDFSISPFRLRCIIVPVTGSTQLIMILKPAEEWIGKIAPENFVTPLWRKGKII